MKKRKIARDSDFEQPLTKEEKKEHPFFRASVKYSAFSRLPPSKKKLPSFDPVAYTRLRDDYEKAKGDNWWGDTGVFQRKQNAVIEYTNKDSGTEYWSLFEAFGDVWKQSFSRTKESEPVPPEVARKIVLFLSQINNGDTVVRLFEFLKTEKSKKTRLVLRLWVDLFEDTNKALETKKYQAIVDALNGLLKLDVVGAVSTFFYEWMEMFHVDLSKNKDFLEIQQYLTSGYSKIVL
jgi:hypothetical protein